MKNIAPGILFLILLAACSKAPESTEPVVDLAAGKAIAEKECSACHGMDGRGVTPEIPNLNAQPAQYLVDALHAYRDGGRIHAALQDMATGMSEADIANIAAYYASQAPTEPEVSEAPGDKSYTEGAEVAVVCEECHGSKGISTTAGVPNLAGQQPAYLIAATMEYRSGARSHEDMEQMLADLQQVDIEKMAMYFAAQTPPAREAPPFGDPVAGEADSASCGKCHGAHGISHQPLVPSLASQDPTYLVRASKAYRDHERVEDTEMPPKTDAQYDNIAAYYATQKMTAPVGDQFSVRDMAEKCDRCHNPPSGQRKLNIPSLRGQNHDYLVKAMKEYRDADRDNSMMHKMSANYSDEMIEALASYYASH